MPSRHDSVVEDVMFSGSSSSGVRPFVRPDRYCYYDISRKASTYSPILMTWLDSGGQRSKVKVTAGRRRSEGVER